MTTPEAFPSIDLSDVAAPSTLADVLMKDPATPLFNATLTRHRKIAAGLRKAEWPEHVELEPESSTSDTPVE